MSFDLNFTFDLIAAQLQFHFSVNNHFCHFIHEFNEKISQLVMGG